MSLTTSDIPVTELKSHPREHQQAKDVQVPIDTMAVREYNIDHVARLKDEIGTQLIDPARMRAIAELGIEAKSLGIIQTIHGSVMMGREAILKAIEYLNRVVTNEDLKDKVRMQAAREQGYLVEKLNALNLGEVKVEETVAQVQIAVDQTRRKSFKPMQKVVALVTNG